jgi:NADH-quinone oxidoreductase subunit N
VDPDVYQGAPTPVTLVIGSGPKLAAFAMAVRLLVNALPALAADWQQMLALLAILSMALGNITAIAQSNLKRMLAYSAIANMGFMLLGLLSGVVEGNWLNRELAYSAGALLQSSSTPSCRSARSACCASCRAPGSTARTSRTCAG